MTISLYINGEHATTGETTLAGLLVSLGYTEKALATAVNGEFVSAASRAGQPLEAGMKIEILQPVQGG